MTAPRVLGHTLLARALSHGAPSATQVIRRLFPLGAARLGEIPKRTAGAAAAASAAAGPGSFPLHDLGDSSSDSSSSDSDSEAGWATASEDGEEGNRHQQQQQLGVSGQGRAAAAVVSRSLTSSPAPQSHPHQQPVGGAPAHGMAHRLLTPPAGGCPMVVSSRPVHGAVPGASLAGHAGQGQAPVQRQGQGQGGRVSSSGPWPQLGVSGLAGQAHVPVSAPMPTAMPMHGSVGLSPQPGVHYGGELAAGGHGHRAAGVGLGAAETGEEPWPQAYEEVGGMGTSGQGGGGSEVARAGARVGAVGAGPTHGSRAAPVRAGQHHHQHHQHPQTGAGRAAAGAVGQRAGARGALLVEVATKVDGAARILDVGAGADGGLQGTEGGAVFYHDDGTDVDGEPAGELDDPEAVRQFDVLYDMTRWLPAPPPSPRGYSPELITVTIRRSEAAQRRDVEQQYEQQRRTAAAALAVHASVYGRSLGVMYERARYRRRQARVRATVSAMCSPVAAFLRPRAFRDLLAGQRMRMATRPDRTGGATAWAGGLGTGAPGVRARGLAGLASGGGAGGGGGGALEVASWGAGAARMQVRVRPAATAAASGYGSSNYWRRPVKLGSLIRIQPAGRAPVAAVDGAAAQSPGEELPPPPPEVTAMAATAIKLLSELGSEIASMEDQIEVLRKKAELEELQQKQQQQQLLQQQGNGEEQRRRAFLHGSGGAQGLQSPHSPPQLRQQQQPQQEAVGNARLAAGRHSISGSPSGLPQQPYNHVVYNAGSTATSPYVPQPRHRVATAVGLYTARGPQAALAPPTGVTGTAFGRVPHPPPAHQTHPSSPGASPPHTVRRGVIASASWVSPVATAGAAAVSATPFRRSAGGFLPAGRQPQQQQQHLGRALGASTAAGKPHGSAPTLSAAVPVPAVGSTSLKDHTGVQDAPDRTEAAADEPCATDAAADAAADAVAPSDEPATQSGAPPPMSIIPDDSLPTCESCASPIATDQSPSGAPPAWPSPSPRTPLSPSPFSPAAPLPPPPPPQTFFRSRSTSLSGTAALDRAPSGGSLPPPPSAQPSGNASALSVAVDPLASPPSDYLRVAPMALHNQTQSAAAAVTPTASSALLPTKAQRGPALSSQLPMPASQLLQQQQQQQQQHTLLPSILPGRNGSPSPRGSIANLTPTAGLPAAAPTSTGGAAAVNMSGPCGFRSPLGSGVGGVGLRPTSSGGSPRSPGLAARSSSITLPHGSSSPALQQLQQQYGHQHSPHPDYTQPHPHQHYQHPATPKSAGPGGRTPHPAWPEDCSSPGGHGPLARPGTHSAGPGGRAPSPAGHSAVRAAYASCPSPPHSPLRHYPRMELGTAAAAGGVTATRSRRRGSVDGPAASLLYSVSPGGGAAAVSYVSYSCDGGGGELDGGGGGVSVDSLLLNVNLLGGGGGGGSGAGVGHLNAQVRGTRARCKPLAGSPPPTRACSPGGWYRTPVAPMQTCLLRTRPVELTSRAPPPCRAE